MMNMPTIVGTKTAELIDLLTFVAYGDFDTPIPRCIARLAEAANLGYVLQRGPEDPMYKQRPVGLTVKGAAFLRKHGIHSW